jgi:NADH-quinone oxidoreductase subunit M
MSLSLLWVVPAAGAIAALAAGRAARYVALVTAGLTFGLALAAGWGGAALLPALSYATPTWAFGIRYSVALDGLSLSLLWLTGFLTLISILSSWRQQPSSGYWAAFLALESALMGVFLVRDLFFFYIFWEAALVPMFFIIGLWGSDNRRHAAVKFFLFTFAGSVLMLLGFLALVTQHQLRTGTWTWDMDQLRGTVMGGRLALAVFGSMVLGFGVKVPIVPLHTWLPDAHTEAPAAGSIMLAGVMLKMGVYGFLRIAIPVFPELSWHLLPWLGAIAAVGVIYGALCAMAQQDLKRLIAYSSVAHLGFCLLGVFSRTDAGVAGGSLQLLNHGITTGALFLLVGILYERSHKRGLADFGGLAQSAPWLTFFFGLSTFASIGLPGLNGFVGEFMSLAGMTARLPALGIAGVIGVTLAAAYALPAFASVFWAEPGADSVSARVTDLTGFEQGLCWALVVPMIVIGLYPKPLLLLIASGLKGLVL